MTFVIWKVYLLKDPIETRYSTYSIQICTDYFIENLYNINQKMRKLITLGLAVLTAAGFTSCNKGNGEETVIINSYVDGEDMPGGSSTAIVDGVLAFSSQSRNVTSDQQTDFFLGNSFFKKDWVIAPASTTARDGLGPFFNAKACATCHFLDGRGRPPLFDGEKNHGLLLRLSVLELGDHGGTVPDPNYGGQLQDQVIPGVTGKGDFVITYETILGKYDDGTSYELKKPIYSFVDLSYGAMAGDVMISPRVAPQMIGLGLLEALSENQILENEDPSDTDNDGISGRANYVWDKSVQEKVIGRFGWKANQPTLRQQDADAFLGDIGITTSINPNENCASGDCLDATNGGSPEFGDDFLDAMEIYSQTLAPPYRENADDATVLKGKQLFFDMRCTSCHVSSFVTGNHKISALSNQTIFPYTDLLLHDMGDNLSDNRPDFDATGNEWRTPPLWGIGKFNAINNHTRYLHDGRARNMTEAILWHGGEASQAQLAFLALSEEDREAVIIFLNSL
jgi:CxxC motif-containing protein (DUF1111 family)